MVSSILYYMPGCPYCQKVLRFMEENKISIPLKNTSADLDARDELFRIGGKTQVPCLLIGGETLYESADIIQYLRDNWGKK